MQPIGFMKHLPSQSIALSNASARVANPIPQRTVMLWATVDCFYVAGDSAVVSTADVPSVPIPAYTPIYVDLGASGNTYIAAMVASGNGTLYVVPCV